MKDMFVKINVLKINILKIIFVKMIVLKDKYLFIINIVFKVVHKQQMEKFINNIIMLNIILA